MRTPIALFLLLVTACPATAQRLSLESPNHHIVTHLYCTQGGDKGDWYLDLAGMIPKIPLGLVRSDQAFWDDLHFLKAGKPVAIDEQYSAIHGKRSLCRNKANEVTVSFENGKHSRLELTIRAYDDGLAFRYRFPDPGDSVVVKEEMTAYTVAPGTTRWLEKWNPANEGLYKAMKDDSIRQDWCYPALFNIPGSDKWFLLHEADLDRTYCGSKLSNTAAGDSYKVTFPDQKDGRGIGASTPTIRGPWQSPWRVIIAGNLGDIVGSTLVEDLSPPSVIKNTDWIKPGLVSWNYWSHNHGTKDYKVVCAFTDLAARMHWPYTLFDWEWDAMGNGGDLEAAAKYALSKGVRPLIWYNSGGPHTYVTATPRDRMLTHESRVEEFRKLKQLGFAGVKVDFFESEKQDMIRYYLDILEDAAKAEMMVYFHGCIVPRGWSRTWPNLMTGEAVRGAEWYNNGPDFTLTAPEHNCTLPFTRNVVGPMDYTPVTFTNSQFPHVTSYAHELALSVVFESGLQHLADRPDGYDGLPDAAKHFLMKVPNAWDDTRLLDGYPGQDITLARRKGTGWWLGGLNGTTREKTKKLSFAFLPAGTKYQLTLIADGEHDKALATTTQEVDSSTVITVRMLRRGGFAATLRPVQKLPYQDPSLSSEERAKDLISRLTLKEKALLMQDQSPAIPRLGIKKFNWWSEALHGLANNDSVTVFPEPVGMAASFDDTLVYKIFDAVSDETRAKYNQALKRGQENRRFLSLSVWTPNINIFRDPRWGRGQETYGEDPYLTSRMGVSVVKGLQGPADARCRKLLACAKHYAVHSGPEWSRHTLNVNNVDPRELWETYLPAFKSLVTDANVREVMCAYQRLDDEPCCGSNRLLQTILREDWGFKYIVVSDCGAVTDFYSSHKVSSDAVHASAKAALAGTDVECVWAGYAFANLPDAVKKGLVTEKEIDKHLLRILTGRIDLGDFDDDALVPWTKIPSSVINNPQHRELALNMARESMTLLRNNDNILPLSKGIRKLAVIGPNADNETMLWGNYNGKPIRTTTILNGIRSMVNAQSVVYDKACDLVENKVTQSYFSKTSIDGAAGFKAKYWNNREGSGEAAATGKISHPLKMTTAGDHEFAPGVSLVGFSATYETEFEAPETEEIVFKYGATGHFELLVDGVSLARSNNWRTLPSRAPFKVEKGKKYKIQIRYAQLNNWQANLEFDFGKEVDIDFSSLINRLKGVDVVIFAGGLSTLLEGEEMPVHYPGFKGGDRTDIELPEVQRNCLKALKAAGKKVVFVNCSGSAIAFTPVLESCDAILQAWYGGELGGQAVADVLFGNVDPSGKLPVTFYKGSDQLKDFESYSMKGRTYRYMSDGLFPFGFGLSYTTFSIGDAEARNKVVTQQDGLSLAIPVSNTGKRAGTEVIQVYIRKSDDSSGLLKTLRGFSRVTLPAGKTIVTTVTLPYRSFEFYNDQKGEMCVTPGEYDIWYGNSSADRDLKKIPITVK